MDRRLFFYNPENDGALANSGSYTPGKGAAAVARAGSAALLFMCEEGDCLLVRSRDELQRAERVKKVFNLSGEIVLSAPCDAVPTPWGWSTYTRALLASAGVPSDSLPTDEWLSKMRMLSHRRTTVDIHRCLATPARLAPIEAHSEEEAMDAVRRFDGDAVAKLPWSSSGRGVIYSNASPESTFRDYIKGMLRRQGSVMIERRYDRLQDFALLFKCSGGVARFRGMSLFVTDGRGFYGGNLIAPQSDLMARIPELKDAPGAKLSRALTEVVARDYEGWLGVDMLSYRSVTGEISVAPCIEVNLRLTMGIVAMHAATRLSAPGILKITPSGMEISPLAEQEPFSRHHS